MKIWTASTLSINCTKRKSVSTSLICCQLDACNILYSKRRLKSHIRNWYKAINSHRYSQIMMLCGKVFILFYALHLYFCTIIIIIITIMSLDLATPHRLKVILTYYICYDNRIQSSTEIKKNIQPQDLWQRWADRPHSIWVIIECNMAECVRSTLNTKLFHVATRSHCHKVREYLQTHGTVESLTDGSPCNHSAAVFLFRRRSSADCAHPTRVAESMPASAPVSSARVSGLQPSTKQTTRFVFPHSGHQHQTAGRKCTASLLSPISCGSRNDEVVRRWFLQESVLLSSSYHRQGDSKVMRQKFSIQWLSPIWSKWEQENQEQKDRRQNPSTDLAAFDNLNSLLWPWPPKSRSSVGAGKYSPKVS